MKFESTALAGQKETTCHDKKERAITHLEFSVVILTCLSIGKRLVKGLISKPTSKMGLVNLSLLSSLRLVFNQLSLPAHVVHVTLSQSVVLFPSTGVGESNIRFGFFDTWAEGFEHAVFISKSFLITTNVLAWLLGNCMLIYLFICSSISIFYELFSYVTASQIQINDRFRIADGEFLPLRWCVVSLFYSPTCLGL